MTPVATLLTTVTIAADDQLRGVKQALTTAAGQCSGNAIRRGQRSRWRLSELRDLLAVAARYYAAMLRPVPSH